MSGANLRIAVVGLGFGADFVPLYLSHPDVSSVVLVDRDSTRRREVAGLFGVGEGHADLGTALDDSGVDAVHILAPVHLHADMVVATLQAGKHCACAVPMATTLDDIDRIIAAQEASGANYMMMETTVYGREYLTIDEMYRRGEFGDLTLYRGVHIQNLDGFPRYWQGYPPMHYVTHALSPLLALLDTRVTSVQCRGAGRLTAGRSTGGFDNPFPTEVGLFTLDDSDVLADITMSFFQTARSYIEGFALYGEHRGVEWPPDNEGDLALFEMRPPPAGDRGNVVRTTALTPRNRPELLPSQLGQFTQDSDVLLPGMTDKVRLGAHHGGSHPFLVHEFIRSIVERRMPRIDARRAAAWTAPGICAHQSALAGGADTAVPDYQLTPSDRATAD